MRHQTGQTLLIQLAIDSQDNSVVRQKMVRPLFPYLAVAGIHVAT
jgi:hypothetical protein